MSISSLPKLFQQHRSVTLLFLLFTELIVINSPWRLFSWRRGKVSQAATGTETTVSKKGWGGWQSSSQHHKQVTGRTMRLRLRYFIHSFSLHLVFLVTLNLRDCSATLAFLLLGSGRWESSLLFVQLERNGVGICSWGTTVRFQTSFATQKSSRGSWGLFCRRLAVER